MSKVTQWLTRGVSSLGLGRQTDRDDLAQFERVDGQRLDERAFRSSASMRLDASGPVDFSETIPAYNFIPPSRTHERRSRPRVA